MLRVVIKAPTGRTWLDHAGNRIYELEFSRNNEAQYVAGHYAIESFGKLDRNIEDFRKSPLQSLSDWDISLPSVFSSKDYQTKTIDLLYWIEAKNEAAGIDFDLTGSEAILYDGDNEIYKCVVSSTSTSNLRTDIRFSESMGSPEINTGFFPTVAGSATVGKWQVQIEQDHQRFKLIISNRDVIISGFYIYMENSKEYIPIEFASSAEMVSSLAGRWIELAPPSDTIVKIPPITPGAGIYIPTPPGDGDAKKAFMSKIRPTWLDNDTSPDPDLISIGGEMLFEHDTFMRHEYAEAWSSFFWEEQYVLGRTNPNSGFSGDYGKNLPVRVATDTVNIKFHVEYPIESMVTGPNPYRNDGYETRGNIQTMRDISLEYNNRLLSESEWERVPTIKFNRWRPLPFELRLKFPIDLPSKAKVVGVRLSWRIRHFQTSKISLHLGDKSKLLLLDSNHGSEWIETTDLSDDILISDLEDIRWIFPLTTESEGICQIAGFRLALDLELPLEEVKALYVDGKYFNTQQPDEAESGNSVVRSVQMLLSAANIYDYDVIPEGQLNDAQYGNIMRNESFKLREKLRSLAAESGIMIKFSKSTSKKEIILKSVSRMHTHKQIEMDLSVLVLVNNIYNFKMESPDRNDIASSVVISWGKNILTGNYEHTFEANAQGLYTDGHTLVPSGKWGVVIEQLKKGLGTAKNLNTEWIMDWEGAEIMAYDYLCWNCAPLRKAQAECITSNIPPTVDIGEFLQFDLPGYPPKFHETLWVVTGMHDDLDKHVTTIELLEAWNMPTVPDNRYLLMENGNNILLEDSSKIKLEKISDG